MDGQIFFFEIQNKRHFFFFDVFMFNTSTNCEYSCFFVFVLVWIKNKFALLFVCLSVESAVCLFYRLSAWLSPSLCVGLTDCPSFTIFSRSSNANGDPYGMWLLQMLPPQPSSSPPPSECVPICWSFSSSLFFFQFFFWECEFSWLFCCYFFYFCGSIRVLLQT